MSTFLSRGIDYLGDLGAKLRDLQGFRTLAHELIQNADDAHDANAMCFDVTDEALIVDNDGVFSDCGQIELEECPWTEDGKRNHRCDFHRFRHVASGDKRSEPGTTGAFGIGFIAVYQVTDQPELLSAGRHWILHEDRPESERIEVCPGCPHCRHEGLPGTRVVLPWAQNPDSPLRRALRAEVVSLDGPDRLMAELERALPAAMLFLKRLRTIEIRQGGRPVRTFRRFDNGQSLLLKDGEPKNDRIWHIIRGDFSQHGKTLRAQHPAIEDKRSTEVMIAVPASPHRAGLLCACLPTEQDVGLPFHVNADFFPTNDRKRVILADDYQSAWNREALLAAARAVGEHVTRLKDLLGAPRFWAFVSTLKDVADGVERDAGESTLAAFWKSVAPQLRTAPVLYTTIGGWITSAEAVLLLQREESLVIPLLEGLGVHVVHEDLRPYQSLLRGETVGVQVLTIERLCSSLIRQGMDRRLMPDERPPCLGEDAELESLWREISVLLERQLRTPKAREEDERRLGHVAIAPGRDGALWPCGELYAADEETVTLFESLNVGIPFVSTEGAFEALADLCPSFGVKAAIDVLLALGGGPLEQAWQENESLLPRLFAWFENRRHEILDDAEIRQELLALPIYPSSGKLRRLDVLALPGDFQDPLGLADLVDLTVLGGRREFLRDLGMPELDFKTYAVARLPAALNEATVPAGKRRAAVLLLASKAGVLKDDKAAQRALAVTPLIECTDQQFRPAHTCYFEAADVKECLGDLTPFAVLPKQHHAAVRDLYEWLGVAVRPRLEDIVETVLALTAQPYAAHIAIQIQRILMELGTRTTANDDPSELMVLKRTRWLPAAGRTDRWYLPDELYAVYSSHLFESQALFLDAPRDVQGASSDFLKSLGVHLTPSVSLVVKHLIHCAELNIPVNADVYRFLNNRADDAAIGTLKGRSCLWLGDAYYAPDHVFWGEHPFGQYRRRLGEDLRGYGNMLKQLDVRDTPDHRDARHVLMDVSAKFGAMNTPLDEDAHGVLMACWRMLDQAVVNGGVTEEALGTLCAVKCVPNASHVLNAPEWMFFENRAGLAQKFGSFLTANVIPRPLGAGDALAAAGVRPLGSAVEIDLLECVDPADDPEMAHRIRSRRNEIGRVLESQGTGGEATHALAQLDQLRCVNATSLVLRYRLRAFRRELQSEPEQAPALFQAEETKLLFSRRDGQVPWAALARELAGALFPEEDPGRFAAGLKEVLAPETAIEAAATLDELGFARLDTQEHATPAAGEKSGTLGTDTPSGDATTQVPGMVSPTEPEPLSPDEAIKRLLGQDSPAPTPPPMETETAPDGSGARGGPGKVPGSSRRSGRPVLRSWLPPPNGATTGLAVQDAAKDGESSVDKAGVRRVMEHEKMMSRYPKEMPHNNPGYDIESRDASGKILRYIEVKSFSGRWRDTYADLTRTQFDKASDLGDAFWLYVVEGAETDEYQVHRIQNPAVKANHFMFDDGWLATAEPEPFLKESD